MRILLFANNWVGWQVLAWLREQGEEIVGVVIHPEDRQQFGPEILSAAELPDAQIFFGNQIEQQAVLHRIEALAPDIGISVFFGYIMRAPLLDLLPHGCLNLHPGFLPYNRGAYTNVWSIVDGTPAGATLHYVDEGIDTGDIVLQREVPIESIDTGERLFRRLERACIQVFQDAWPLVRSGRALRFAQQKDSGTFHRIRDAERIDAINEDRCYRAEELIDIIRARTFPPYRGAYIVRDGQRIYLRLQLFTEGET